MKNKIIKITLISLILITIIGCSSKNKIKNPYTQEYVPGQGNIKGNVDVEYYIEQDPRFAIGADKNGIAVFKNPQEAYEGLIENYSSGISLIQEEFDLKEISEDDYDWYKVYGWQVTTGSDEEQEEAHFITRFLDIYENSFD